MSYIGKEPQFTQYPSKFFNGDGTAMTVTLDYSPPNAAALLVFIDGVRQDTSAYTLSGTSLTFTGTVPSGTNNVQVVHLGLTQDVGVPSDDTISTAKIQDDAVTSAKLANSLNITSGNSLTIDSGATITNNGTASGFGKVLQVVSTTKTDTFSASLGQAVPSGDVTGLTATITPSSTSNKILVTAHICGSNSSNAFLVWLYRDGSALSGATGDSASNRSRTTTVSVAQPSSNGPASGALSSFNYFDSPATTSSITYSIRVGHTIGGTDTVYVNRTDSDTDAVAYGRSISTITLMEIAG